MTSNLAAAFASMGKKVIQIGCDPKADSTINLLGGTTPIPVMNYMREYDEDPERIEDISNNSKSSSKLNVAIIPLPAQPSPGVGPPVSIHKTPP